MNIITTHEFHYYYHAYHVGTVEQLKVQQGQQAANIAPACNLSWTTSATLTTVHVKIVLVDTRQNPELGTLGIK